ncbi:MAG TPA: SDR family NAD(P)-dependent oxidoreductase [Gemmatimonadaceae bacterium]|nr:SDR family NAD(P)-dependent oxidoreductase [Gemmatimonadaceae bacterium]
MGYENGVVVLTGIGKPGQTGEVVAQALLASGARLAVVSRSASEAESRAAALRSDGADVRGFPCDLSKEAEVASLAGMVRDAFGDRVDALINMAGGFAMSGPVAESDFAAWQHQLSINLTTAYLATRAFLPALRAARGSIVYFSSAAALPGARVARMSAYAASKSAVIALMHAVAQEESQHGVRANAVAPTSIRTAANVESMGTDADYVSRSEVASTVLWLCSAEASAVTGQVVELQKAGSREQKAGNGS